MFAMLLFWVVGSIGLLTAIMVFAGFVDAVSTYFGGRDEI